MDKQSPIIGNFKPLLPLNIQFFAAANYAELYLQALQQKFTQGLMFNKLYNSPNNADIKFTDAKTVKIPRILTGGFVDVNRDVVGSFTRRVDNQFDTKTLGHDREFKTLVDPVDIDETNLAMSIANITRVFNDEHKIPEMDKYAASKLHAEFLEHGGVVSNVAITSQSVLEEFDKAMLALDEAEVPQVGRILYVTPVVNKVLKQANELQRQIGIAGANGQINRSVYSLDDVEITVVPSSRMKTVYDFTDGAVAGAGAKQINMILIHPTTVITPQKYDFVSLDNPSAATGGKYLYYERKYWDLFVIEAKVAGIAMNVEGP